jgi:hypothetical protein
MRRLLTWAVLFSGLTTFAGLALAPPAGAQVLVAEGPSVEAHEGPTARAEPDWGLGPNNIYAINAGAFNGWKSFDDNEIGAVSGERYCTALPLCALVAPINLPTGSVATAISVDAFDSDPAAEVECQFLICPFQAASCFGTQSAMTGIAFAGGNANPIVAFAPPRTIDNSGNTYLAMCVFNSGNSLTRFRAARVYYELQVSPAPGTATFSDVPVGAFGFQHIEALAASGITAGCGGGNFCPNATLTRAQMAVFLAKALGLHWPD